MKPSDLDYQAFAAWIIGGKDRNIRIEIKNNSVEVIVGQWFTNPRDYVCQFVEKVDEIDLLAKFVLQQDENLKRKQQAFEEARQALESRELRK